MALAIPTNTTDLLTQLQSQAENQRFIHETFKAIDPHISAKYKRKLDDTEDTIITVSRIMHTKTYNP